MTIEEAEYYIKEIKAYTFYSIKIKSWPPKHHFSVKDGLVPFDVIDHYIDIRLGKNLVASEKLRDLTLEKLFEYGEFMIHRFSRVGYEEWKKKELRNHRLSLIIKDDSIL